VLFGKTAKLLLSVMIWVEETKESLILQVYAKTNCGVRRLRS